MLHNSSRLLVALLLGSAGTLSLSGCESSGGLRLGAVGSQSPDNGSGAAGDGSGTTGGGSGSDGSGSGGSATAGVSGSGSAGSGGTGSAGTGSGGSGDGSGGGSQSGSGLLSKSAVPGIAGPGGAAGTGLLANSGNPSNPGVVGAVLVAAGNAALSANGQTPVLVRAVDRAVPGSVPLAGTVSKVLGSTGQALVETGQGKTYLVDGLTASVGQAVSLNVLDKAVLPPGTAPLVGTSVLSTTQNAGTLATVGVDAAGRLATATTTPLGGNNGTAVSAVVPGTTGLAGTVGSVVDTAAGTANNPSSILGSGAPTNGLATAVVGSSTALDGGSSPLVGAGVGTSTSPSGTAATVQVLTPPATVASVVAPAATSVTTPVVNGVTAITSGATSTTTGATVGGLLGGGR